MAERHQLDSMFHPKSVAVVGASASPGAWGGASFLGRLQKLQFVGSLYPVNPKATEVNGLRAYSDIKSIPEPPELVIIAIPGPAVPQVLEDCITAGVKNVHIFSSGFAETGLEEGRQLDRQITRSELVYLLVLTEREHGAEAPAEPWPDFYAQVLLRSS